MLLSPPMIMKLASAKSFPNVFNGVFYNLDA
jgi:hypothetical protein